MGDFKMTSTRLQTVLDSPVIHKGVTYNPHLFVKILAKGLKLVTIQLISNDYNWNSTSPVDVKNGANEHVLGFIEYITGTYQDFYNYKTAFESIPVEERNSTADLDYKNRIFDFMWGIDKRGHSYQPEDVISYIPYIFVEERAQHSGIGKELMKELLPLVLSDLYLPNIPFKRNGLTAKIERHNQLPKTGTKFEPRDKITSFYEQFGAEMCIALPYYNILVIRLER